MIKTLKQYRPLPEPKNLPAFKALKRMLEFLKTKKADVCIVVPPMHRSIKAKFIHDPRSMEVLNIFESLSKKYRLKYASYWADDLPDNYFQDYTHVNHRGAQYFTNTIYQRCFTQIGNTK